MNDLIAIARQVQGQHVLATPEFLSGEVGASLRTKSGRVFSGVSLHLACGIGTCAEHAAVLEMLKSRETEIDAIVAVSGSDIVPPCGRCRELLIQVSAANLRTKVILSDEKSVELQELLPFPWLCPDRPAA